VKASFPSPSINAACISRESDCFPLPDTGVGLPPPAHLSLRLHISCWVVPSRTARLKISQTRLGARDEWAWLVIEHPLRIERIFHLTLSHATKLVRIRYVQMRRPLRVISTNSEQRKPSLINM